MNAQIAHALEVRQRLLNPANAVTDDGIDLKRVKTVEPISAAPVAIEPIQPDSRRLRLEKIQQEMAALGAEHYRLSRQVARDEMTPDQIKFRIESLQTELDELRARAGINPKFPTISAIQSAAAAHYGLKVMDLISNRRTKKESLARKLAIYLCRELTPHSLPSIGRHFNGRDHTTILHSVQDIQQRRKNEPEVNDAILALTAALND